MRTAALSLVCVSLGLVAGCTPVYMAPAANAPLFGSGGELHGQFQYDAVSGIDLHGAFSPFKHFGIQAGMSFLPWNDEDARESERYYGELGAGAYIPFGIGRFEVFAGGGYGQALGRMDFDYEGQKYYSDGKYGRIYVQADIGLSTKIIDFCLMSRYAWVTYDFYDPYEARDRTADSGFIEEMIVFRAGYDPVKFEFQAGFIWPAYLQDIEMAWIPWHVSIGLHVKFDLWGGSDEAEQAPPASNDGDDGWKSQNIVSRLW